MLTGTVNSGCFLLFRAIIASPLYEKGYGTNHSPWGIISCSVFHFHEDGLIFRFHELRHTFAVLSLQNGDNVKTVQGNLGHATAAFTLDVYGHVSEKLKEDSAQRMEKYISNL